jgi:hypothetical protein
VERKVIYVNEGEIAQYVFNRLIEKGYAVTNDEAFELGYIFFDYLLEKSIIKNAEDELKEDE